ncbi:MAG: hypothetical protein WC477_02240 [Patescibacteria group bacterium]
MNKSIEQLMQEAEVADRTLKNAAEAWIEVQRQIAAANPSAWVIIYDLETHESEVVPVREWQSGDPQSVGYSPSKNGVCRFELVTGGEVGWRVDCKVSPKNYSWYQPDYSPYFEMFESPETVMLLPMGRSGTGSGLAVALDHKPTTEECTRFANSVQRFCEQDDGFESLHWCDPHIVQEK